MPKPPQINAADFLVSLYKNPHTGKLYGMNDKATFMKELKVSIKHHQEQEHQMEVLQLRKTMWTELRTAVRSVHDLEPLSRERCTIEMEDLYLTAMRGRRLPSSNFWSLPIDSVKIAHHSISHDAPLGMRTNWCLRDKNHIGHKIALIIKSPRNLNETMYGYSQSESGFRVCNGDMYLFADDWPFVQRMALGAFLSGNLSPTTTSHPMNTFMEDLKKYSLAQAGCPLEHLQNLHTMGLCTPDTLMALTTRAIESSTLPEDITDISPAG